MESFSAEALAFAALVFLPAGVASATFRNLSGTRAADDREHRLVGFVSWAAICGLWVVPLWNRLLWALAHARAGSMTAGEAALLASSLIVGPYLLGVAMGHVASTYRGRIRLRGVGLISWREHSAWEDLLIGHRAWMQFVEGKSHYLGRVVLIGTDEVALDRIHFQGREKEHGKIDDSGAERMPEEQRVIVRADGSVSWFAISDDAPERTRLTGWHTFWAFFWAFFAIVMSVWLDVAGLVYAAMGAAAHVLIVKSGGRRPT